MAYPRLPGAEAAQQASQAAMLPWIFSVFLIAYAVAASTLALHPPPAIAKSKGLAWRLEDNWAQAEVHVQRRGQPEQPCAWKKGDGLFQCAEDSYAFVSPYAGYAAGQAQTCTWLHPLPGGATTILRWPKTTIGNHLQMRLALLDEVGPGTPVQLKAFVDNRQVVAVSATEGRELGFAQADLPTGPATSEFRLEIQAADNAWRLACAQVWMTGERALGHATPGATDKAVPAAGNPPRDPVTRRVP